MLPQRQAWLHLTFWLLLGIALVMSSIAALSAFRVRQVMAREESVSARISQLLVKAGENDELLYAPLVEFYTTSSERYEVLAEEWAQSSPYVPGQRVTVRYDPSRPQNIRIVSLRNNIGRFTLTLITGSIAIASALAGAITYRLM